MLAYGYVNSNGQWTMICNVCKREIEGTISTELFSRALITHGPPLHPECRKALCPKCQIVSTGGGLCIICKLDEDELSLSS